MQDSEKCNIVFAADEAFAFQLQVVVSSALFFNDGNLVVHVLDCQPGGFSEGAWKKLIVAWGHVPKSPGSSYEIRRHLVDMETFGGFSEWNGSRATYARLLLGELLPDVHTCLYSDCDVLFLKSPCEVFAWAKDKEFAVAGHKNGADGDAVDFPFFEKNNLQLDRAHYFCAGFILLNLDWFRETDVKTAAIDFLGRYPDVVTPDQSALNYLSSNKIVLLPDGWGNGASECFAVADGLGAIHYAATAPWKLCRSWYDYLMYQDAKELWYLFCEKVVGVKGLKNLYCSRMRMIMYSLIACLARRTCRVIRHFRIPVPVRKEFINTVCQMSANSVALKEAKKMLMSK